MTLIIFIILIINNCSYLSKTQINSDLAAVDLKPQIEEKNQSLKPTILKPTKIKIYVEDQRPQIETEKTPSSDYVYSGALFNLKNNIQNISEDLSQIIVKSGGSEEYEISKNSPHQGPSISLILESWYSKIPKKQENLSFITIYGAFDAKLIMKYDDKILATKQISEEGVPTIISTYIISDQEKYETPTLIWNGMLSKANSAQQFGYRDIFEFLQINWSKFQK